MKCPFCEYTESKVIDTRPTEEGISIRRRRECLKCEKRFTTYEQIETMPIVVIKKDKSRQCFDREKILNGLFRACIKRPVSTEMLEGIVNNIESQLANSLEREFTTEQIGQMVLQQLKDVDQVAYVRFASVYKEFKDVNSFMNELKFLQSN
jgi:transcriptional repressor NrdR